MSAPSTHLNPGMARRTRRVHFVGIGGIGMSGIAEVLLDLGFEVAGSDAKTSEATRRLASRGADVRVGHDAAHVEGADVVVVSSAVRADNAEVVAARARKIPVIRRAEMLAELMRLRYGIAIGGSHGKTTTTSLVAAILEHAGAEPTVVVGGKVNRLGAPARLGAGPYLVAEADESDGSFLQLGPTIAVVTNIDPEHLDHYVGGLEEVREAFLTFVNRIPFYGLAVLCLDHPGVQAILPRVDRRLATYGLSAQADVQARDLTFEGPRTGFELLRRGRPCGRFSLRMLGEHNVQNALAALTVSEELGIDDDVAREALAEFDGVERRFTVRGEVDRVMVVDDYGHHPAELRATLAGARRAYPDRRLVVAFQPHRYTRTRDLLPDFAAALLDADVALVAPIYAAGEAPIEGVDAARLVADARARGHRDVVAVEGIDAAVALLEQRVRPGDLVITLGAGDVTRASGLLVERLGARRTASS